MPPDISYTQTPDQYRLETAGGPGGPAGQDWASLFDALARKKAAAQPVVNPSVQAFKPAYYQAPTPARPLDEGYRGAEGMEVPILPPPGAHGTFQNYGTARVTPGSLAARRGYVI